MAAVTHHVKTVLWGGDEQRLRATWRFLLAWPLLPVVGVLLGVIMPVLGVSGMIPGGPIQGVIFLGMLVVWAGFVDRRALSNYGVSASPSWMKSLLVVLAVWGGWHTLAASLGWIRIELSFTSLTGSVVVGLVGTMVSLAINSLVQDLVFFAIVLQGAAEGFRSRGLEPRRAVIGGWLVSILFFAVIHGMPGPVDVLAHAVGGAVFGALYVHTDDLALTVGVHWGSSWAAGHLFAGPAMAPQFPSMFEVTTLQPGVRGLWVSIPLYLVTYVLLVGWLRWRRGAVTIETDIAEWIKRDRGVFGTNSTPVEG